MTPTRFPCKTRKPSSSQTSRPVFTCALRATSRCRPAPANVSLYPASRTPGVSMPGDAAHITRGRVVYYPAQQQARLLQHFSGRDARPQRIRRLEHAIAHAQRFENGLANVIRKHLPAEPVHDLSEQNKINVAVDETHAGRTGGLVDQRAMYPGFVAAPWGVEIKIRAKT